MGLMDFTFSNIFELGWGWGQEFRNAAFENLIKYVCLGNCLTERKRRKNTF